MIKEAIIPLAGLGTRMLPLTKVIPKELWPLGKLSILERILQECEDAKIKKIYLIISKRKNIIKKFFDKDFFLEKKIRNNLDLLNKLNSLSKYKKKIKFIYQNSAKGLGDAVNTCKNFIKSSHFLLILPDDIIVNNNCSKELINIHNKSKASILAIKKVPKNIVNRYGVVGFNKKLKNIVNINKLVEKPNIKQSPSSFVIIGRYILSKKIFKHLSMTQKGSLGEIQITDAMSKMLNAGQSFKGCIFKGSYLDCGTMDGYIKSFKFIGSR
jgi:UTP--glucose-1-phosphate uridylyltransferase